jgi:NADH:ubiquinone oxidoreductase subunit F (NADH-binding)
VTALMPLARTLPPHRLDLAAHVSLHGPLPWPTNRRQVIETVDAAGLLGRGGGGFPVARKLASVRGRRAIVVANGCEGDPLSAKDRALLAHAPHLVLDGIQIAAYAVGATEAVLCLHVGSAATDSVVSALAERRDDPTPVRIVEVPPRYVASEESALVHYLTSGDARPTGKHPRPSDHGVDGRPTLVQNVDTLAQLALVTRIGPETYRRTRRELVTISGAVRQTGVIEVPAEWTIAELLVGQTEQPVAAVLVGGYGGTWLPWRTAAGLQVTSLPGISSVYALPSTSCGLAFTADVLARLAAESARQCGPCMFGLPAIAEDFADLIRGQQAAVGRLARRLPLVTGRGACAHPDGAVRLAASALDVFQRDVTAHIQTRSCSAAWEGPKWQP